MLRRADRVIPEKQATHLLSALILMSLITEVIMKLTQARLKELLDYDPETGVFTRLKTVSNASGAKKSDIAGCINKTDGYRRIRIDGKDFLASRLAFLYMEGYFPEYDVDHKNRIRYDDRWCNLRHASRQCNLRNCSTRSDNKSRIVGISWLKRDQKWRASITISGKAFNLGHFISKLDAAKTRWEAEKKHNFPNCNTTSTAYQYLQSKGGISWR